MAGRDNVLLKDHEFKFDSTTKLERRFPSRETGRKVALSLRRAGFDCKMMGATLILLVPEVLADKARIFGGFS